MDSSQRSRNAPLGPALRALAARARQDLGPHPDADDLVAYSERRLGAAESERLRDHLALCPECAGLLLDLGALADDDEAAGAVLSDRQVEAAWRDVASRLGTPSPRRFPPRHGSPAPARLPWAVAATLLVGVGALAVWVGILRQDLRSLSRPRADAVLAALEPRDEGTRGGLTRAGPDPVEQRPRTDRPATLILRAAPATGHRHYELRIEESRAGGRVLWRDDQLRPRAEGEFVVTLPARALPAGAYLLRLYGMDGDRRDPLADYELEIAPADGAGEPPTSGEGGGAR
jgi:hypothetical protein